MPPGFKYLAQPARSSAWLAWGKCSSTASMVIASNGSAVGMSLGNRPGARRKFAKREPARRDGSMPTPPPTCPPSCRKSAPSPQPISNTRADAGIHRPALPARHRCSARSRGFIGPEGGAIARFRGQTQPRRQEQPAGRVNQHEPQMPPTVPPRPQVRRTRPPVWVQRDRHLRDSQGLQRRLDDHLGSKLHSGRLQMSAPRSGRESRWLNQSAQTAAACPQPGSFCQPGWRLARPGTTTGPFRQKEHLLCQPGTETGHYFNPSGWNGTDGATRRLSAGRLIPTPSRLSEAAPSRSLCLGVHHVPRGERRGLPRSTW